MKIKKDNYVILKNKPETIDLEDGLEIFGKIEELITRKVGVNSGGVAKVTLRGPDFLHRHRETKEFCICWEGKGLIRLNDGIFLFNPGDRIVIGPGTTHAAKPLDSYVELVFLCISVPAFDPSDFHKDPRGREW